MRKSFLLNRGLLEDTKKAKKVVKTPFLDELGILSDCGLAYIGETDW